MLWKRYQIFFYLFRFGIGTVVFALLLLLSKGFSYSIPRNVSSGVNPTSKINRTCDTIEIIKECRPCTNHEMVKDLFFIEHKRSRCWCWSINQFPSSRLWLHFFNREIAFIHKEVPASFIRSNKRNFENFFWIRRKHNILMHRFF